MTENVQAKIERIISEPTNFKFGDYIGRGFELVQKDLGNFIVFALIFVVGTMVIGFIPFVGTIANSLLITPALTVGIYLFAHRLDKGERPDFGTFFKGFDHIGQLALAALTIAAIVIISLVPFGIIVWNTELVGWYREILESPGTPPTDLPVFDIPWWSFLLLLPAAYFGIAYGWTYLFIAFYKMDFWPAMEASRRLITKNWFMFFLFSLVTGLIAGLGVILLCIGILFTFPAAMCMVYSAFADVTKLHEEPGEGEGIEQHLIA